MKEATVARKSAERRYSRAKCREVANRFVFPMIRGSGGSKRRSLKRQVRGHVVTGAMKNCATLWRKAHFQVKMYKTRQRRTTFGSSDVDNRALR